MFYNTYKDVTILSVSKLEGDNLLRYLTWTDMMFLKLLRPKMVIPPGGRKFFAIISIFESLLRCTNPTRGWSAEDLKIWKYYTKNNPNLLVKHPSGGTLIFGISPDFVKKLRLFPALCDPTTIRQLCKTLDRRLPTRYTPPLTEDEQREAIDLVVEFFQVFTSGRTKYTTAEDRILRTEGAGFIDALRTSQDLKSTAHSIHTWVERFANERHLSKEKVNSLLEVNNIL